MSFQQRIRILKQDAKTHAVKMRIVLLIRMEELTADADQVLEGKTNIQMLFAQNPDRSKSRFLPQEGKKSL
jgi:hypothetical protein